MSIFYFHPRNTVAQKLADLYNAKGFGYTNRNEMDLKLYRLLTEADYDMWPTYHTIIGSLAGAIDTHIVLDGDNELDRQAIKVCANRASWSYVKLHNGPKMSCVVGYCNSNPQSPYSMGVTEMAQKGMISVGYVPR